MDTLLNTQPASAGVSSLLVLGVWAAAIIAAVIATVLRARGTGELQEQIRELERKLVPPAAPVRNSPSRATPSFGATFYESSPSPFESLLSWPGAAPTLLAAVLALAGTGLLVANGRKGSDAELRNQQQLSGLKAAHDSLALTVKELRDSLRIVAEAPAVTAARKPAAPATDRVKPLATAARRTEPKSSAIPAATGVLPAAPKLDAGIIPPSPKAPVTP